ncbi:MAG: carbohydrate kinase family protein, partial [Clostridiales bacterium]|nr:carbohydrate kinase family protein [Clostridiales bacterium]
MKEKKWDIYIYGDVNIDLVIPGVEEFPKPGQEDIVDQMETFIGGGAALFTLGIAKLGLNPVFQCKVGNDFYGKWITAELEKNHVDTSMLTVSSQHKTGISISFTNEKDRSFLTYRGTNEEIELGSIAFDTLKEASHIHITGYSGLANHQAYYDLLKKIKEIKTVTISFDLGWDDSGQWY